MRQSMWRLIASELAHIDERNDGVHISYDSMARRAVANPIPLFPPVMRAFLPASFRLFLPGSFSICRAMAGLLLLPSAAKSFVELHEASILISACISERQLGRVERALTIENFEIVSRPTLIAHFREAHRVLQISH